MAIYKNSYDIYKHLQSETMGCECNVETLSDDLKNEMLKAFFSLGDDTLELDESRECDSCSDRWELESEKDDLEHNKSCLENDLAYFLDYVRGKMNKKHFDLLRYVLDCNEYYPDRQFSFRRYSPSWEKRHKFRDIFSNIKIKLKAKSKKQYDKTRKKRK